MADFDDTRKDYVAARSAADHKRTDLIRAREQAKCLRREADALTRQANVGSGQAASERLRQLERRLANVEANVATLNMQYAEADAAKLDALTSFALYTDPTEAVGRLPDDTPMALFPLRLETRFKTIEQDGAPHQFLWVRVFRTMFWSTRSSRKSPKPN